MNNRIEIYDIIKGLAIFLVVLGHTIQAFDFPNEYFVPIYMFHMPLFMIISGYFFYPSIEKYSLKDYIKRKTIRLLIPSLFWGIFNMLIINGNKLLNNSPINLEYSFNIIITGMWFLVVLYVLSVIGGIIYKKSSQYEFLIWGIIYIIILLIPPFWIMNEIKFLLPFFLIGYMMKIYKVEEYIFSKYKYHIFLTCLLIFVVCLNIFTFDFTVYKTPTDILSIEYFYKYIVRFLSGISGSFICFYICKLIEKTSSIKGYLLRIGITTLPIYVLHQKFLLVSHLFSFDIYMWLIIPLISFIIIEVCILLYKNSLIDIFNYFYLEIINKIIFKVI